MKARSLIAIVLIVALSVPGLGWLGARAAEMYAVPEGIAGSLIGCWELDEESGQRNDSYNSLHLTDNNTVGFTGTGIQGKAAYFVRSNNEYLNTTSLSLPNTDFTISLWTKVSDVTTDNIQQIIAQAIETNDLFQIRVNNSVGSPAIFQARLGTAAFATILNDPLADTWYHVVIRSAGTTHTALVNNSTSTNLTATNKGQATALRIGGAGANNGITGSIDVVMLWSRSLSNDEVTYLYNSGSGRSCATMIAASNPTATPTNTTVPTSTQTPTATATNTPVPSATPTHDHRATAVYEIDDGGGFVVDRSVTYGDMATFFIIGIGFIVIALLGFVRLTQVWFR